MWASATESDPPDTAATTRVPAAHQIVLADELTNAVKKVHESGVSAFAKASA